jgi:hypothetical protein
MALVAASVEVPSAELLTMNGAAAKGEPSQRPLQVEKVLDALTGGGSEDNQDLDALISSLLGDRSEGTELRGMAVAHLAELTPANDGQFSNFGAVHQAVYVDYLEMQMDAAPQV